MIDTHCHIYLETFEDDLEEVLQRAADSNVNRIYMPAINFDSLTRMSRLSHNEIAFYRMAGLHPTQVNEGHSTTEDELASYCKDDSIVGVGETGLDYHWSSDYKKEQIRSLNIHCEVAKELGKPVILHNRESTSDLLDVIESRQDGRLKGVWHCFTGTVEEGKKAIDLGLFLGIGGVFTFNNAGVDTSVGQLPLDRMVLETDAPYLAPEPKRGRRNEPAFIRYTADKLAEVKNLSPEEVDDATSENAKRLFHR